MKYMAYRLKFKLFAQHYINIQDKRSDCHSHTWNITLYIDANSQLNQFHNIENVINIMLDEYSNTELNSHPEFADIEPTLENIGEIFFNKINSLLSLYNFKLNKLEISETPTRVYVVRNKAYTDENKRIANAKKYLSNIIFHTVELVTTPKKSVILSEPAEGIFEPFKDDKQEAFISEKSVPAKKEYGHLFLKSAAAVLFILVSGILLLLYINKKGRNPWGSDSFGHVFKADLLYKSIKEGQFYPLYTSLWYNGIQPFRYWAPIPYYIMAFLQFMTKGDAISAYNLFVYFCYTVGAAGWLLWGIKEKRVFVSVLIGVLWFCMPDNVRVFFSEGNIPRITIAFLLPYMFFFIFQYIEYKKLSALAAVVVTMSLISMCHLMIAAMLGITTFIFLIYYGAQSKTFVRPSHIIIGMLLGISLCGVWLYPALQGGLMSIDAEAVSEVMKLLTFPATQSLNPMLRLKNIEIYYFGIAFVVVALAGVFLSNKKSMPGFSTLLTVFLGTTTALVPILIKLPLNQLLWMMRFTPIAYAVFSLSIILWKNAKRITLILLMALIFVDCAASFKILAFNSNPSPDLLNMYDEVSELTSQRTAIMDLSEFGSFPSYRICSDKRMTQYAYGWAWQGASTSQNIVLINTAFEKEYYGFMFDRCLELGCDTVLVKKDRVKEFEKLDYHAHKSGYKMIKEYNNGFLYKRETPKSFGLISKYYGLAIGDRASNISLQFPGYQIGNNLVLDEYSLEEITEYEMVYVSGFSYRNKKTAEKLLYDAADRGIKVIVDMNAVPNDPITNRLTFMGVTAQPIQFENRLPDLHVSGEVYFPTTFKEEFRKWNTVYLEEVPNPTGFSWMGGNKLAFIGKGKNSNITYVGFNLLYHGMVNEDNMMTDIYAGVMGKNAETLPEREVVPIDIRYEGTKIYIDAPIGNVNTTLANLDAFVSKQDTQTLHNLLCTVSLHTQIDITYPYIGKGLIISIFGFLLTLAFFAFVIRTGGEKVK